MHSTDLRLRLFRDKASAERIYIYIKLVACVCFLTLKGNPTELNKMSFVRLNNMGLDPKLLKINVYCYILLLYVFYSLYMRKYD